MQVPGTKIHCASHLSAMLTPTRAKYTVSRVIKMIRECNIKFDSIACRGVSGLLIAPIVAMQLNKSLLVIRKGEDTHSAYVVEGDRGAKRYLILDDFIDEGHTVKAIISNLRATKKSMRCVGFIAYKRLSFKNSTNTWERQMELAWWDRHDPEEYIKVKP